MQRAANCQMVDRIHTHTHNSIYVRVSVCMCIRFICDKVCFVNRVENRNGHSETPNKTNQSICKYLALLSL